MAERVGSLDSVDDGNGGAGRKVQLMMDYGTTFTALVFFIAAR